MEKKQKCRWHVHTDANKPNEEFFTRVRELGFTPANFDGHPNGFPHFEPVQHSTRKVYEEVEFRRAFEAVCNLATETSFTGYIEGEFVSRAIELPDRPFTEVPFPFLVQRRTLDPVEKFRESEFHLTFDVEGSDERRIQQLLEAGLFGAYEVKPDGRRCQVLTVQGYSYHVGPMVRALEAFLLKAGGLVRAKIKIERAVAWKLFGIMEDNLPHIADQIIWTSAPP